MIISTNDYEGYVNGLLTFSQIITYEKAEFFIENTPIWIEDEPVY